MQAKFANKAVLAILLICRSSPCLATESSDPNNTSKYLDAVRTFADNVLKYGRDTYGPKHTPLFVDGLMVRDLNDPNYGKDGVFKPVEWIAPNGDRWVLSNLASQQNLFRMLVGLTAITGDPKYRQAAVEAIEYAFANLRSPNGLLYWGASIAYDVQSDKVRGSYQHVLKAVYPYYELMWQVDPSATQQFIESFWSAHILDWSNLEMNRIGLLNMLRVAKGWEHEYKGGPVFFKSEGRSFDTTGADLYYAAYILFKLSGQKKPLIWAKRLAHRYVETRNPKTGISSHVFTLPKYELKHSLAEDFEGHTVHMGTFFFSLGLGNPVVHQYILGGLTYSPGVLGQPAFSPRICQFLIGGMLGKNGKEFQQWALEELSSWGKVTYRKEDNSWIPMFTDGTSLEGYVCKTDIEGFGLKGNMLKAWKAGLTDFWTYALAYRTTGDKFMWEMARSIALGNNLGDIGQDSREESRPNMETYCSNSHGLLGFLALYEKTGKREFLKMAQRIGNNILKDRFHHGFFVPSEKHVYAKFDAIEPLVLLHLNVAFTPDCPSPPTVWPSRPRFEQPYRGKEIACDRALIYTLTESVEPPISLNEAAAMGDLARAKSLLAKGADVNNRESLFKTPLHSAARNGHKEMVKLLLEKGAHVDAVDSWPGGTPLHYAVEGGHKDVAELLIANEADVNAKDNEGQTPVDIAVSRNRNEVVKLLIEKGADVSLHSAAYTGDLATVQRLIENGADVNAVDFYGATSLYYAAVRGRKGVIEFFIARGADVNAKNKLGETPLHRAAISGRKGVVELLIDNAANINARDQRNYTPMHYAVWSRNTEVAELFIEKGADVQAKDRRGWTPLHYAADGDNRDMAELLIVKGADVNAKEKDGKTSLQVAKDKGYTEIVELLRKHGAKE